MLRSNLCQASRSLCTSVVSWTCLTDACLRECCTLVNMPLDPVTARVILCNRPRSLRHLYREVLCASRGMSPRAAATLSHCVGGRRSRCVIVSRSHPSTVFQVNYSQSPFPSFLKEMVSLLLVSASLLGCNTRSIWWKRCRIIWNLSLGPPWKTEIKSSS